METLRLTEEKQDLIRAGEIMKEGGIVAFPTDTVYGLGAVYSNEDAVKKIFEAKGRDEGKPLSILISNVNQVQELAAEVPAEAKILMKKFWPGALTLIFKKKDCIPDAVTAGGNTIGIRMPSSGTARALIEAAGAPVAAPSANTSGKRSSVSCSDVLEDLDGKIDAVVDGGSCEIGVSSTVLDMSGSEMKILREGTVTREIIDNALV